MRSTTFQVPAGRSDFEVRATRTPLGYSCANCSHMKRLRVWWARRASAKHRGLAEESYPLRELRRGWGGG
jgi:hypothetical protein